MFLLQNKKKEHTTNSTFRIKPGYYSNDKNKGFKDLQQTSEPIKCDNKIKDRNYYFNESSVGNICNNNCECDGVRMCNGQRACQGRSR